MDSHTIGWVGLGNMGKPMIQNLTDNNYKVTVYNRTRSKAEQLENSAITVANSPLEVVKTSDIIFLMVSDDEATEQLFTQPEGLLDEQPKDKIFINMSTVSPGVSKKMSDKCKEMGSKYLDAPVSGSVPQAQSAQLVIMVGGEAPVYNTAYPYLKCLGKMVKHVGKVGAGNSAKLAVNTLLAFYSQGLAEVIGFSEKQNINIIDLLEILENGGLNNPYTQAKGKLIVKDHYAPDFALKHMAKDLSLAKQEGMDSPLATTAHQTFSTAAGQYGDEDVIAIYKAIK